MMAGNKEIAKRPLTGRRGKKELLVQYLLVILVQI
jgi:hypothetical protein